MEFKQIQDLIRMISKSDVGELKIKDGDFEIQIRSKEYVAAVKGKDPVRSTAITPVTLPVQPAQPVAPAPQPSVAETGTQKPATAAEEDANLQTIKSPMIGTFYRSPAPDKDSFVKVGDTIQPGDVLCIIEAMKLFNEIESEVSGKIVKVLIEDSSPVEYDQPLFLVEPA